MAQLIDGKLVSQKILENLKNEISLLAQKPTLAVIIVGEDAASKIYVNLKKKKAQELGINSTVVEMPVTTTQEELLDKIENLNQDNNVNAILVQLPLPKHIDTKVILEAIIPMKDVDCFNPYNMGKIATGTEPYVYPCTPKGILALLDYYNVDLEGKNVVVIGRSNIVGRPMAQMFINKNSTVTLCHSKTKNLEEITKTADIIVCAVGHPNLLTAKMIKHNAIIIDVGMNRLEDGKLCGDVDFSNVEKIASFITPVPGGVGPMTICSLMQNTFDLYSIQTKK